MRRLLKATRRRYERGAIAVEAAIVLPVLLVFLGLPSVYLAFYCRQYAAAEKAVHDAALYLSTAPRIEMITAGPDGNPAALGLANTIIERMRAAREQLVAGFAIRRSREGRQGGVGDASPPRETTPEPPT